MKYLISTLIILMTFGIINSNISNAFSLELKLTPHSSILVARAHFLPDYQSELVGSTSVGSGKDNTETRTCESIAKGYKTNKKDNEICKSKTILELICYYDCKCAPQYTIKTCPNGQQVAGDTCNGFYAKCEDCSDKISMISNGWSLAKPCTDTTRLRTNTTSCALYYHCCSSGYSATDYPNRSLIPTSSQKIVEEWSGSPCKKLVAKTCGDYGVNYQEGDDKSQDCTRISSSTVGGLTNCFQCKGCDSTFEYTSSNCTSPRSFGGSVCGGAYNQCNCPTGISGCSLGCLEYYPSPCQSVCKSCKSCSADYNLSTCPDNTICDKCGDKYKPIGCSINYADTQTYWCSVPNTDCLSLGYKHSIAQCGSLDYVRCPFDKTKIFCFKN